MTLAGPANVRWRPRHGNPVSFAVGVGSAIFAGRAPSFGPHVTFAWDAATDPSTAGYYVDYGTSSGSYTWTWDAGNVTQVSIYDHVVTNTVYYAVAQAYDGAHTRIDSPSGEASGLSIG